MTPSIADYVRGLRRLWWVPVLALLIGSGLSFAAASGSRPAVVTTGHVLFTFQDGDQGQDSAGAARGAEAQVAKTRLAGYIQLALSSQPIHDLMLAQGISTPPTTIAVATGQPVDDSARVVISSQDGGVVSIQLENEDLDQATATQLTKAIADEVARSFIEADSLQASPSLEPSPVVTDPQGVAAGSSILKVALPLLLLLIAGFAIVYVVVWVRGWIWTGRDLEDRLGARTLGEVSGRPEDGATIALALTKDRTAGTSVLLVPVAPVTAEQAGEVGDLVTRAWSGLDRPAALVESAAFDGPFTGGSQDLRVAIAAGGLDAEALRASVSADVVGLVVGYGRSRYTELTRTGRALAKVTDADIAVVGLAD